MTSSSINSVIQQYQSLLNNSASGSNGSNPLMTLLGQGVSNLLPTAQKQNSWMADILSSQASSNIKINKTAVWSNLWQNLEKKVKSYESLHPETKGQYVVAINPSGANGQPVFKIVKKSDVTALVNAKDQKQSDVYIADHPVQAFVKSNVDVSSFQDADIPGLKTVVSQFMTKNSSVFQFLANTN
jgi:hypothetical protein